MKKEKSLKPRKEGGSFARYFKMHYPLYIMLIPGLLYIFFFKILPYYGIQIAFKDYNIFLGKSPLQAIKLSPWVGLKHFKRLFAGSIFTRLLRNTLTINGMRILFLFPLPIIVSIALCEIRNRKLRSIAQTSIYIPYFFSWAIIYGIFVSVLDNRGLVNAVIYALTGKKVPFLTDEHLFRWVLIFTDGWKTVGYNAVIFMAAIIAVDTQMFEAAKIDGANKWQQIWHITIPSILPTIILMLILKVGHILDVGWEQVLIFYNPAVYETADVIQTYVYRIGIGQMNFSQASAMELFNSVVAFILIVSCNWLSKKTLHRSIW